MNLCKHPEETQYQHVYHSNSKKSVGEPGRHIKRTLCTCGGCLSFEIYTIMNRESMYTRSAHSLK